MVLTIHGKEQPALRRHLHAQSFCVLGDGLEWKATQGRWKERNLFIVGYADCTFEGDLEVVVDHNLVTIPIFCQLA